MHRRLEGEPRSCARLVEDGGKLPSLQPIRVGAAGFEARRPFEEPRDQGMVEVLWPSQMSGDLRPRERSGQGVGHPISPFGLAGPG